MAIQVPQEVYDFMAGQQTNMDAEANAADDQAAAATERARYYRALRDGYGSALADMEVAV